MRMSDDWPQHSIDYKNGRDFRSKKRDDIRKVLKAMDKLRRGCVYTPAYLSIVNVYAELENIKDSLSVKKWKR